MSRNVVGDVQMTNNPSKAHVGGASEADVSAADVELAAMNAKPSNVIPGIIIVCLAISLGCSVGASATDEWAVGGNDHFGTLCVHSLVRPHAGVHWPALQKFATACAPQACVDNTNAAPASSLARLPLVRAPHMHRSLPEVLHPRIV